MSETRKEPPQEMTQLTDEEVKAVTGGAIVYDPDPDDVTPPSGSSGTGTESSGNYNGSGGSNRDSAFVYERMNAFGNSHG